MSRDLTAWVRSVGSTAVAENIDKYIEQVRSKQRGRGVVGPDVARAIADELERLRAVNAELEAKIAEARQALS